MTNPIVFSVIGEPSSDLLKLLDEFQQIRDVQIKLEQMEWEDAWAKLLSYALTGKSPDVSHVGSTWVSSLVGMNAVRSFSPREVGAMGGVKAFVPTAWQSATLDDTVYSIPWSSFTFLVFYRRDHLKEAGIAEEHAFDTADDFHNTIKKLKDNKVASPLILPSGKNFLDRVHIAASWMWGAGGDYFSSDGRQALLNQPETHAGLRSFFELYRLMSPNDYQLDYDQTLERFVRDSASVVIADCGFPATIHDENPDLAKNVGVHPLPGAPFVSGDNLIVWQDVRHTPDRERISIDLVSFLVSETAQKRFCRSMEQMPVRHDSLSAIQSPIENLVPILKETFEHGRSYKPIRLWGRYEQQLGSVFDNITNDIITKIDLPIESILEVHLSQLQQRFSLLVGDPK
jgi:ABC-type glycerol-3-phosphate transport system substrate-binding protein